MEAQTQTADSGLSARVTHTPHADTDGVPPGLDLALYGTKGYVTFNGVFYANPGAGQMMFKRRVQILFASKEILVAYDLMMKNIYVINRETGISLGCRMNAVYTPENAVVALPVC
jgi:hypothetical protein